MAVAGLAGAAVAIVAAVALSGQAPGTRPPQILESPTQEPTSAPTAEPTTDTGEPEPQPQGPIESAEWVWEHARWGADGIVSHADGGPHELQSGPAGEVVYAIGLDDGTVVNQIRGSGDLERGGIFHAVTANDPSSLVVSADEEPRLLTVRGSEVWYSVRASGGDGEVEHLRHVDLLTGQRTDVGESAGPGSGTDAIAFLDMHGLVAWNACHIMCTTWLGPEDGLTANFPEGTDIFNGNLAGLGVSSGQQWLATVRNPDPNLPDDGPPVVLIADVVSGEVVETHALPAVIANGSARVEFVDDGTGLLVADATQAWVVDLVNGTVAALVEQGRSSSGATLLGGRRSDPSGGNAVDAGEWANAAWPLVAVDARQWDASNPEPTAETEWRTDSAEVARRFVTEFGFEEPFEVTLAADPVDEGAYERIIHRVSGSASADDHVIHLARIGGSPHWWVTRVEPAGDAASDQLYSSYEARDGRIRLSGGAPSGTTIDVLGSDRPRDGVIEQSGGGWSWEADIQEQQTRHVGLVVIARRGDGTIQQLSTIVISPGNGAAG